MQENQLVTAAAVEDNEGDASSALLAHNDDDDDETRAVVIDSLPYVDTIDENYEEYALQMIQEEMKTAVAAAVPNLPRLGKIRFNSSTILKKDWDTLVQTQQLSHEHEIIADRAQEPSVESVDAWRSSVRDARAEYEAERQRSVVLEISKSQASSNQWKQYISSIEPLASNKKLTTEQTKIDSLNAERQVEQEKAGQALGVLSQRCNELVDKRYQLQTARKRLEDEVELLKQQRSTTATS